MFLADAVLCLSCLDPSSERAQQPWLAMYLLPSQVQRPAHNVSTAVHTLGIGRCCQNPQGFPSRQVCRLDRPEGSPRGRSSRPKRRYPPGDHLRLLCHLLFYNLRSESRVVLTIYVAAERSELCPTRRASNCIQYEPRGRQPISNEMHACSQVLRPKFLEWLTKCR